QRFQRRYARRDEGRHARRGRSADSGRGTQHCRPDPAFTAMLRERPDAIMVTNEPFHQLQVARIIEFLAKNRLPGMFQAKENVAAGGLIAYGTSVPDLFRRAAGYVHRILQGTKPADLPVELPTKFDLAVNLRTAKALGLDLPPTLIAQADEVIE